MSQRLKDKCIIVTGGSRGIGAGIARNLAEQGARIALTFTSKPEAAQDVCKALPGSGHLCVAMNIADANSVSAGFEQIMSQFERLDVLVNNAGITKDKLILRMKDEEFDAVIQTNLRGTFLCAKHAAKIMLKGDGGSIINISSVIGQMGNAGQTNYAASKAGIEGFTRALALELASRAIRVNAVAPGFIATDMTEALDAKQQDAIKGRIPLGRLGTTADVGHCVAFLASDESSYITGQVIGINGGLYM